jgi:hypothetical protein
VVATVGINCDDSTLTHRIAESDWKRIGYSTYGRGLPYAVSPAPGPGSPALARPILAYTSGRRGSINSCQDGAGGDEAVDRR